MTRSAPPLLLVLAFAASGCGKLREVSACRGLVREVNGAVDDVERLTKKQPVDELAVARRYGALANALAPRAVGDRPLPQAVREYLVVVRATEAAVRS